MTNQDFVRFSESALRLRAASEIVVGLDEGTASAAALRWAARQSQLTGLPLRMVHVWQMPAQGAAASSDRHHYWEAAAGDARARTTRWAVNTLGGSIDLRWTLEVFQGTPGAVLAARSAKAHLLVLGAGRQTGPRGVLGSVSRYCLRHALPPVVTVPPTDSMPTQLSGQQAEKLASTVSQVR